MSVAFIGGGNMATALIGGVLRHGRVPGEVTVVEPVESQRASLASRHAGIEIAASAAQAHGLARAELIVLAVKPQQMRDAVGPLVPFLGASEPVVLSIAAGLRLADIGRWLGDYPRLVRAMPNTPALIGEGVAGMYASAAVDQAGRTLAADVLRAGGDVVWVDDETMLDAITGVSGSGPAYVFYFLEALERAARELGFDADTARKLAYRTFSGAIALAQASEHPPATLRAQVTSKGGTTERALESMQRDHVGDAIVEAVKAATQRARELGDLLGRD
ncbi:MAG TPA: pyrroline-5-carboxylate reductase [Casimicrobiaceae bacterium]|nr:pyrroline-5-carboxylate reductase [Casimicrobiaceae bacterium]